MFYELGEQYPENHFLQEMSLHNEELLEEFEKEKANKNDFSLPLLAEKLNKLTEQEELRRCFPGLERGQQTARGNYKQAIRYLYLVSFCKDIPEDDPYYDNRLRKIREHLISLGPGGGNGISSEKQLEDELSRLKKEKAELENKLKKMSAGESAIDYYKKKIRDTQAQIDQIKAKEHTLSDKIKKKAEVQDKLNNLIQLDNRVEVMKRVRQLLASHGLSGLKVDENAGVIRVQRSFIDFKETDATNITNEDASDIDSILTNKQNARKLATLLDEIGKEVNSNINRLPVDNISIECIQTVRKGEKRTKVSQSLRRAYALWRYLNESTNLRLSGYNNSDKLGLYSLSGSGGWATDTGEYSIMIRFNCSPIIVHTSPDTKK